MRDAYTNYPRTILWLVRGGTTMIGGTEPDARPTFQIELDPFYISKLPITNQQYEAFDKSYRRSPNSAGARDPAVGVSFDNACAYADWYSEVAKKAFRLPTELEWEYACRAGCEEPVYFDDPDEADDYLWHAGNSGDTIPDLEAKKPNGFGLFAMLGGVWDWTSSDYRSYPIDPGDRGETNGPRVLRGGSYRTPLERVTCSLREALDPAETKDDLGFRLVKSFR